MTYYENLIKHVHAAMKKHPRSPVAMTTDTFEVVAAGKNVRKMASAIRKGNALHNIPLVNGDYIYVPSSNNKEVYVLGEVDDPTIVGFKEGMTLMQAVTYAGGRKETSAFDALVIRGNIQHPKVFRIYMEDILRGEIPDFRLKPNDIVYLPKGTFSDYNVIIEKMMPTAEFVNLLLAPFFGGANIAIQSPTN